jgi:hypothetical protein
MLAQVYLLEKMPDFHATLAFGVSMEDASDDSRLKGVKSISDL